MSMWDWVMIIAEIVKLIAEGMSKSQAVCAVGHKFGISAAEIWKHGGF